MKKLSFIFSALLVSFFALTSCDNYLTADNKTAGGQTAEQYFSNDPEALLVYAYSLMKPIVAPSVGDANIYCDGTDLYSPSRGKSPSAYQQYTLTPEFSNVETFYSKTYACINMANAAIHYAGEDNKIADEAKFIRSYCYYLLAQQFGRVPYRTEYINNAERNYPLTDTKEIYDNIIAELTAVHAAARLESTDLSGHTSLAAVAALLAKVNLAAGWDIETTLGNAANGEYTVNGNTYFNAAADWAEKAITLSGANLSMTFADKWSPANERNAEVLFAVQYERAGYPGVEATGGHGLQNTFGNYYGDCTSTGEKYVNSLLCPTAKANKLWEVNDQRYAATFMTVMYNYTDTWGTEGYYAYYNTDCSNMPIAYAFFNGNTPKATVDAWVAEHQQQLVQGTAVNKPYVLIMSDPVIRYSFKADGSVDKTETSLKYHENLIGNGMNFTPVVCKWDDPNSSQLGLSAGVTTNDYRDVVLLHLSDTYLDAAEAYLLAGKTNEAEAKLNAVRARAGLEATTFASYSAKYAIPDGFNEKEIDFILDERARETYAENRRWMDLRRTKQLVRYNVAFNEFLTDANLVKWYRPIPQAEINSNTAITDADQNAGY